MPPLPTLRVQAERLLSLGVVDRSRITAVQLREAAEALEGPTGQLLALHPDVAPVSGLAPLMRRSTRAGFVVVDMTDVDQFGPTDDSTSPPGPVYAVAGPERGDALAGASPDEALPRLLGDGRTPLTLAEGVHWVLQAPEVLERNHCFMTVGSRKRRPDGSLDARTPAIWISNGTGRDGAERRDAPKVGWCWAGNRHTWLGFASASGRQAP